MSSNLDLMASAYNIICTFSIDISNRKIILNEQEIKYLQNTIRNIIKEITDILINIDRIEFATKKLNNKGKEFKDEKNNLNNTNGSV